MDRSIDHESTADPFCFRQGDWATTYFGEPRARVLFVTGTKGKPQVSLNGKDAALKPWKDGWLVALAGSFPAADELAARLAVSAALGK